MDSSPHTLRQWNTKNSPLLSKLPGELRNKIYRLIPESSIEVDLKAIHDNTALLRTSSQIREEASTIFYRETEFVITDASAQFETLKELLVCMGPENRQNVYKVQLKHKLPEAVTTGYKTLDECMTFGLTMQEVTKKAEKVLGFPEGTSFDDMLGLIFDNAMGPVQAIAEMLIQNGVPMMSLQSKIPADAYPKDSDGVVESSQKHVLVAMAQTFVETGAKEHTMLMGATGEFEWLPDDPIGTALKEGHFDEE